MAHILITSGPTRQYLDPVRYLTNSASGLMGAALAEAALQLGHDVTVVTGPVHVEYPLRADVIPVVTTEEMLAACQQVFARCDGVIGAAAPCDYRPVRVEDHKISKTGQPLTLHLVETSDVVAALGAQKQEQKQWIVGFALETEDHHFRATTKLESKSCDLMVLNEPQAMNSPNNHVELIDKQGQVITEFSGSKLEVARGIMGIVQQQLIEKARTPPGN